MTKTCCVPGCKSNYKSTLNAGGQPVSTFSIPKDDILRGKWLKAIPRDNWSPSQYSVVCCLHFPETDIVKEDIFLLPDGTLQKIPTKTRLRPEAVPSIFPNLPQYLSKKVSLPRKSPDERRIEIISREDHLNEVFEKSDLIKNFQDLITNYNSNINISDSWTVKIVTDIENASSKIYFYNLSLTKEPISIANQISVDQNMVIKIFLNETELTCSDLSWILPFNLKLTRWSELENLLIRYKDPSSSVDESFKCLIEKGLCCLNKACSKITPEILEECSEDHRTDLNNIHILINQMKLLILKKKRYSSDTVIMSFMLYTVSPCAYDLMRNYLILPTKRYLQYLSSGFDVAPNMHPNTTDSDKSASNYLNYVSDSLKPHEKIVVLLIDEIYVSKRLDYRGKNIVGAASNDNTLATTILAFMICSAFGNFCEIVKLLPVHNIKGSEMTPVTKNVITLVQKCGFIVLDVITDNHRINRSMFSNLTQNSTFFTNPDYPQSKIFVSYDFVHIFKNIINNWRNLKNLDNTFLYPSFDNFSQIKYAKFQDVKNVYIQEKDMVVKKAYKLNHKTIYPNNLERQKVYLADNICDYSTISSLKEFGYHDTADFLEVIRHWWDIVNNTSVTKALIKKNKWCQPISREDDFQTDFLKKFILWLDEWKKLDNNGHLTNDTCSALRHSTSVFLDIIDYSFQNFSISYILPGKFTTEKLEKRFGKYRLLGGSNYNISFDDAINAEKKIRLKHIFRKAAGDTFSLSEVKRRIENCSNESDLDWDMSTNDPQHTDSDNFSIILTTDYLNQCELDESAQIYISGYASHKISRKLKCNICISLVTESKGNFTNNDYFNYLQRGGLSIPTDIVKNVLFHMCAIFEKIINDNSLESDFLKLHNQKTILCNLTISSTSIDESLQEFYCSCVCGKENKNILMMLCSIFSNVLLNDYIKKKNNDAHHEKNESKNKKRKLNTFNK
jgi:THAP domain/Transposase protein